MVETREAEEARKVMWIKKWMSIYVFFNETDLTPQSEQTCWPWNHHTTPKPLFGQFPITEKLIAHWKPSTSKPINRT